MALSPSESRYPVLRVRWPSLVWLMALAVLSAGCAKEAPVEPQAASYLASPQHAAPGNDPEETEDLRTAQRSFARKAYGLSEKHFRAAIEKDQDNAEAWLGLAATYDQLSRFDLADRAYVRLERLGVDRAVVLNNQGYSYMLRGDYPRARKLLLRAQRLAPRDEHVEHNLALLDVKQANAKPGKTWK